MDNNFEYKINGLRFGINTYSPIFMYLYLMMREKFQANDKEVEKTLEQIVGRPCIHWPEPIKNDFDRLFTLDLKYIRLQREIIYFLIYIFSNYAFQYIDTKDQDKMKIILDNLFEIFRKDDKPWTGAPPANDSYSKYQQSKNPLLTFQQEISKTTGEKDSLFLFGYITLATSLLKNFIKPTVDKLFNPN